MNSKPAWSGRGIFTFIAFLLFIAVSQYADAQPNTSKNNYTQLVAAADKAFNDKDYGTALLSYNKAALLNAGQSYPGTKINQIRLLLDGDAGLRSALFEDAIINAEDAYNTKNYAAAKSGYQKALALDPTAEFPKDRLSQLNTLYTDAADKAYFDESVSSGDNALAAGEVARAIQYYEAASTVAPENIALKDKIASAKKQLAEASVRKEQAAKLFAAADALLQAGRQTEARAEFEKAAALAPNDNAIKQKIAGIDRYLADLKKLQDNYQQNIDLADQFYINRDFTNARIKYQEALKAKPDARYPKEMLEKTKSGESQLQTEQQRYDAAVASAANFFKTQDYDGALTGFRSAAEIKPAESYPKAKIAELEKLIAGRETLKKDYEKAVQLADEAFAGKQYDQAMAQYKKASGLMPAEAYPAGKIKEINAMLADRQAADDNYKRRIADADKLFVQKKYDESIVAYTSALELKPAEQYPKQRLSEARKQLDSMRDNESKYAGLLSAADSLLAQNNYTEALEAYRSALQLKPAESYPKQKSEEIARVLAKQKTDNEAYNRLIADADNAFTGADYAKAGTLFGQALQQRPGDPYPVQKLAELQSVADAAARIDQAYGQAMVEGKKLSDAGQLAESLVQYQEAAKLKPSEKLPAERIAAISQLLGNLKTKDENYSKAVARADAAFGLSDFAASLEAYKEASTIKPEESYPKLQAEKAKAMMAEAKKRSDDYAEALNSAENYFNSKDYPNAIAQFRAAQQLKPGETLPAQRIAECEAAAAKAEAEQLLFDKMIAEGDQNEKAQNYESALASYKKALEIKPAESYPAQKIKTLQAILDQNKATDKLYAEAIARGDEYFGRTKYNEALEPYQKANTVKPAEKYPLEQISRINTILAEQKQADDLYHNYIIDGENLLTGKNYAASRKAFAEAAKVKPAEKLPADKIAEIDGILAALKKLDDDYNAAVTSAAESYSARKLAEAAAYFTEALRLKPGEKLPAEKLAAIKAELKAIDDNYDKAIGQADTKLAEKNYTEALNLYQLASELKPAADYPKSKTAEINALMANQKEELEKMYSSYIADADHAFAQKDYRGAIAAFSKAKGLKPAETYPAKRIEEITALVKELELARRAEYNKALGVADNYFNSKIFDQALDAYSSASLIMPDDPYPVLQQAKIRAYIADHAIQDLNTQALQLSEGSEKKFSFSVIEPRLRKNNYILIKARQVGNGVPKVYLNYGRDGQKNGGIVMRNLDQSGQGEYMVRISVQDKWYREDNNWISLFVETGNIEISKIQIAAGE